MAMGVGCPSEALQVSRGVRAALGQAGEELEPGMSSGSQAWMSDVSVCHRPKSHPPIQLLHSFPLNLGPRAEADPDLPSEAPFMCGRQT